MQSFIKVDRVDPAKRAINERVKDFEEIYETYNKNEASTQANRCVQCGDPYCHNKCPLHNFIPQWLKAVSETNLELAFKLSNEPSPFPEVMGKVCPQDVLCEGDCTLNDGYGAITIGSVEVFINEEGFKQGLKTEFPPISTNKKVAIIGSGPAGLSCATFLLRAGVKPVVYERADRAGGLMTYGIPNFKLDKGLIDRRVQWLIDAGMELNVNCEVGKDVSFEELYKEYDALFIGIGATKGRYPNIKNQEAKGTALAMEFLTNIQHKVFGDEYKKKYDAKDKRVVVIGGGDTAMDCVRSSIRERARSVTCLYRRDAQSMPGSQKEYKNALEEGVEFEFFASPKEIITDNEGKIKSIVMVKTQAVEGEKRGKLEEIKGSEFEVKADLVIFALGFDNTPLSFLQQNNIEMDKWGAIKIDENFETSMKNVYAGGDCYRGADLVVTAVYDGRQSAFAMIDKLVDNNK